MGHRRGAGFSLIELMVVVAIIGIIAAVALPSYQNYVRESRRIDAHQGLTTLSAQQERFFSNNNGYTADVTALGYAANPAASAGGYYQLSVVAGPTGVIATSYRVQATPVAGGPQAADATCSPIWQDSTGAFGPSNECWNR